MARVLFVDSDKQAQEVFGELLRARHHEAIVARDCAEAERIMRDRSPDVAVVEVLLADRAGRELIRGLRGRWPKTRIIAMTGASERRARAAERDARTIGADMVL